MKNLITSSVLISVFFISFLNAQSVEERSNVQYSGIPSGNRAVLWDNTNINTTTSGIVSTQLGGLPAGSQLANTADDFVIPNFGIWTIDSIRATGFTNSPTPIAPQYGVVIYDNNGGVPGNIIASDTLVPAAGVNATFINFHFSTPWVINGGGTYWLSVFGVYPTASTLTEGRWNWYTGPTSIGLDAHLQDLTGLFGGFAWTSLPVLGVPNPSCNFIVYGTESFVPVELTSFTAKVNPLGQSVLNWSTASEINNRGFEIERRSAEGQFATIGFVEGYGTTTETQTYIYIDKSVNPGTYYYRLKQIDFDGTFEYSNEIEVDIEAVPASFSLGQNFPNPFNPATRINFALPVESVVTIKIFNVIGEEINNLVKGTFSAGIHNIDFNAFNLNSGVYFYSLEALGTDGSTYSEVKKMMLTK